MGRFTKTTAVVGNRLEVQGLVQVNDVHLDSIPPKSRLRHTTTITDAGGSPAQIAVNSS